MICVPASFFWMFSSAFFLRSSWNSITFCAHQASVGHSGQQAASCPKSPYINLRLV